MKLTTMQTIIIAVFVAQLLPGSARADNCRYVDGFGIYQVCTPSQVTQTQANDRHPHHDQHFTRVVYVPVAVYDTPVPQGDIALVDNLINSYREELDSKWTNAVITHAFYEDKSHDLDQIQTFENNFIQANGGTLTLDQQNSLITQLRNLGQQINFA